MPSGKAKQHTPGRKLQFPMGTGPPVLARQCAPSRGTQWVLLGTLQASRALGCGLDTCHSVATKAAAIPW